MHTSFIHHHVSSMSLKMRWMVVSNAILHYETVFSF